MEETIWIAIGVIAVIIAVGIISQLVVHTGDDRRLNSVTSTLSSLKQKCDFVCNTPADTRLSIVVPIPSGALFQVKNNSMCIFIDGQTKCSSCKCELEPSTVLDLNSSASRKLFLTHDYSCYFTKTENETIRVECRG